MTTDEMRIAVAESLGWEELSLQPTGLFGRHDNPPENTERFLDGSLYVPDYAHDLNAMHEAVKDFDVFATVKFSDHLKRIIQDEKCIESAIDARYLTVNATAPQRCEAYLRVKGLWR